VPVKNNGRYPGNGPRVSICKHLQKSSFKV
jgi:hypothetical protein